MTAFPYSCQTGAYTIDQLAGEDCAVCGQTFNPFGGRRPVRHERVAEWQTYRHRECAKRGAKR